MDSNTKTNQYQIYQVCKDLTERLPDLLYDLDIEYRDSGQSYSFCCPVHGGDNPMGASIRKNSGYWNCWTHSCHDDFKNTIFGFVRGVLSHKKGSRATMQECLEWCLNFLGIKEIDLSNEEDKFRYFKEMKLVEVFHQELDRSLLNITREQVRSSLEIPSTFYQDTTRQDRNFSKEILDQFDVGDCFTKGKEMYYRAVVPIYDESYQYVGCIGRTLNEGYVKWKNSKNFEKSHYLYGLNFAKDAILQTRTVNIVEGQSCIWRLHEAGFANSVGIFGAELSQSQLLLLEMSGALNIVILTDSDEAGRKAAQKIIHRGGRRFNYILPALETKDIAEMSASNTKTFLGEIYDKYNCPLWKKG